MGPAGLSGLSEQDYPSSSGGSCSSGSSLRQMASTKRVPLPAELVEQFGHMQCNCTMGLFPQVIRYIDKKENTFCAYNSFIYPPRLSGLG